MKKRNNIFAKKSKNMNLENFIHTSKHYLKPQQLYCVRYKNETIDFCFQEKTKRKKSGINTPTPYRQEFGVKESHFRSNNKKLVAFYEINDQKVNQYTTPSGEKFRYPNVGEEAESVRLGIADEQKNTRYLETWGYYLCCITFCPQDDFLLVCELNREQNHLRLMKYHTETNEKFCLFETTAKENNLHYLEPEHTPLFIDENHFVWQSRHTGFYHIFLFDLNKEKQIPQTITSGNWEVNKIVGFREKNIFFIGTKTNALEQNLFRVHLQTKKIVQINKKNGTCETFLSPEKTKLFYSYSNIQTPYVAKELDLCKKTEKTLFRAKNPYKNLTLGETKIGTIKAADEKTELYYRLTFPAQFDKTKKYPVFYYVYGGPHVQMIRNQWNHGGRGLEQFLSSKGIISFCLDNRGSANRGQFFEQTIYQNIGKIPFEDQIKGIEFLHKLPFVDKENINLFGWSFGGFMSLQLFLKTNYFRKAVAGGSVTDWSKYEVMYGERYMNTPTQNPSGYEKNNLCKIWTSCKQKEKQLPLLLIHCEEDDIVKFEHAERFISSAKKNEYSFQTKFYKKHKHNVLGEDRVKMFRFILNWFDF
jgi:dipeptidyl aminopeptidase/acylaminoacyl peptidase